MLVGIELAINGFMECYFGSQTLPMGNELDKTAVVSFSIPEIGIRFKAPFKGIDNNHSDFASFLALLEFIDSNQKYFSNHTYQIYGNNLSVINQINKREELEDQFLPLFKQACSFKEKYKFSLEWIPSQDNLACDDLFD